MSRLSLSAFFLRSWLKGSTSLVCSLERYFHALSSKSACGMGRLMLPERMLCLSDHCITERGMLAVGQQPDAESM